MHRLRAIGTAGPFILILALSLVCARDLKAADATNFGYNNLRATGVRNLLVITAVVAGGAPLTHDSAFYNQHIFGPGDRTVVDYFSAVSKGAFGLKRVGGDIKVIGPFQIASASDATVRQQCLQAAAPFIAQNFSAFDLNGDGKITPDELLVLLI